MGMLAARMRVRQGEFAKMRGIHDAVPGSLVGYCLSGTSLKIPAPFGFARIRSLEGHSQVYSIIQLPD